MKERDLIIQSFHFHEVIVKCHDGAINSAGHDKPLHRLPVAGKPGWEVQFDDLPKLIVTMKLNNDVIGIGEFYRDHDWIRVKSMANILLGQNLEDLALQKLPIANCREYYGFESVVYDAFAKSKGLRVVDLIGGQVQEKVKVMAWSSHRSIEEIGAVARNFQLQGYDTLKLKADIDDPVVELCQEIKHHANGLKVVFDPNMRWINMGYAKKIIRDLEKVGNILLLEDPIPHWMWQDFAELRKFSSIPIVMHVSPPYTLEGQSIHDAINAIKHGSVDGFNFNAGIASFKVLDSIATAGGYHCWHGSEIDLGIQEALFLHNASAAQSCIYPSDIFGKMLRQDDLLKTSLRFEPPYAYLPQGLGLGVELNEDAVDKFKVSECSISL